MEDGGAQLLEGARVKATIEAERALDGSTTRSTIKGRNAS